MFQAGTKSIKKYNVIPKPLFSLQDQSFNLKTLQQAVKEGISSFDVVVGKNNTVEASNDEYKGPNGLSVRPFTQTNLLLIRHAPRIEQKLIYYIPAGLKLPKDFYLIHEVKNSYRLQHSKTMSLDSLSVTLNSFFDDMNFLTVKAFLKYLDEFDGDLSFFTKAPIKKELYY